MIEKISSFLDKNNIEYESIIKLESGASARKYFKIIGNFDFTDENSIVVAIFPEKIENAEKGNNNFIKEEPFINIQKYLFKSELNIPKVFLYDEKERIILQEDLGEIRLYDKIKETKYSDLKMSYQNVIRELVTFQEYSSKKNNDTYCFKRKFDLESLNWELYHFIEWRVENTLKIEFNQNEKAFIKKHFNEITSKIMNQKQLVSHRDFQSQNIMYKNDKYYIIDFQDALIASYTYDLVSLLKDSYLFLDEDFVVRMLKFYIQETSEKRKINLNFEKLYFDFKIQTLQRKLKDIGRFHYIDQVKNNDSFLEHIPLSMNYIKQYMRELYPDLYELLYITL